ncbi:hypothetical protein [Gluconacetobacter tumulicola]|uniref:Uncharacterized protein n=1 Tax=Gluconacetobacter tumulicola TaxID=1017177 RepID=A0A7W4JH36_9PROT|nr:hypothetical protein [Gluconacetobacter tumulicola]MBB2181101.1 hypothetical protein [Gluconacetobacter tumulicola]
MTGFAKEVVRDGSGSTGTTSPYVTPTLQEGGHNGNHAERAHGDRQQANSAIAEDCCTLHLRAHSSVTAIKVFCSEASGG